MAQPPQMRQGPSGPPYQAGMPPGPPGPGQAPYGQPGQQPYGPPGQPPFAPPGQAGPVRQSFPPAGPYGGGLPPPAPEELEPPKKKKSKKGGRPSHDEGSSDEDDCSCPCPPQPATQIFITPPGCCPPWPPCPPAQHNGGVSPQGGNGNGKHPSTDTYDLCKMFCYPSAGQAQGNIPQVVCCPPAPTLGTDWCLCCKCKKKCKRPNKQQSTDWCGTKAAVLGEEESGRRGRPAAGAACPDGMMGASQQFLMFLQAYGLAAALIRDRGRREEERREREWQERRKERAKSADSGKKAPPKNKGKGKKKKEEDVQ